MAKEHLVVNGYRVPGGYSGVAVRRACEHVLENPGITQTQLLNMSVQYSGINLGTAGWITSPGPKSPATLLWDRRKEGVFRCYPNEHTEKVVGAQDALFNEFVRTSTRNYKDAKFHPKPGDLVRSSQYNAEVEGVFLGYQLGENFRSHGLRSTIEEWFTERPVIELIDRIWMVVLQNGTGRPIQIWNFGSLQPV